MVLVRKLAIPWWLLTYTNESNETNMERNALGNKNMCVVLWPTSRYTFIIAPCTWLKFVPSTTHYMSSVLANNQELMYIYTRVLDALKVLFVVSTYLLRNLIPLPLQKGNFANIIITRAYHICVLIYINWLYSVVYLRKGRATLSWSSHIRT